MEDRIYSSVVGGKKGTAEQVGRFCAMLAQASRGCEEKTRPWTDYILKQLREGVERDDNRGER